MGTSKRGKGGERTPVVGAGEAAAALPLRGAAPASSADREGAKAAAPIVDADRDLSFPEILQKYERKIFNLILRQIGDRDEAEDLTQETFLNACRSFQTFRGECKVQTWLCQIAMNQCKNRFRQRDRRRSLEGPSLDSSPGGHEEPPRQMEVADWGQSPQEVFIKNETYRYVLRAIRLLPADYRMVIILCDLQQLSYQEIAEITQLSLEAVKTRIHRGRLMLRRKLKAYLRT